LFYIVFAILIALVAAVAWFFVPRFLRSIVAAVGVFLLVALTLLNSVIVIDNNEVGVEKRFGQTLRSAYLPDVHFVRPWSTISRYEAMPIPFSVAGSVVTSDSNPLTVDVGFATKLNPAYAWRVQVTVGENYFERIVKPAAQTAVRDGFAGFSWTEATTSKRDVVQNAVQGNFIRIVSEQLVAMGMTAEESRNALVFSPVQFRQASPDPKVLNAVAERSAALQDLDRQKTLTDIAAEEALRRAKEGEGVTNLFNQLPKGFTSSEIAEVLGALAAKTRADAMLKAVESNQVDTIVMNGDVGTGIAAPVQGGKAGKAAPAAAAAQAH